MYQKRNPLPDYSEWAKTRTVYKCRKDIECKDGIFTKGSFVMLDVCSAEKGEIYVIDFVSVFENRFFDYTNNITGVNVEHDTAVLLPNQLGECFDEVKELSYKINNHNKCINWSGRITVAILIILVILLLIITKSAIIGVAILVAFFTTNIGMFVFNFVKSVNLHKELSCIIAEDENNRDNVSQ